LKRKSKESTKLSRDKKDKRWGLLALIFLFLLYSSLVALYSSHIPIGKGVDEEAHFLYVEDILKSGHLPKLNVPHGGHYESHQPPLFYLLSLPIAYLFGENWRVWGRVFSAILIALSGFICYLAGRRLFKNEFLAIASGAFVLLLPGNILIASGFTNDSLAQALFSLFSAGGFFRRLSHQAPIPPISLREDTAGEDIGYSYFSPASAAFGLLS
jgi:4-amino-4-deoxy-L-arabinose transferase-like glycosyltransferase